MNPYVWVLGQVIAALAQELWWLIYPRNPGYRREARADRRYEVAERFLPLRGRRP